MKRVFFIIAFYCCAATSLRAQQHKIVYDLSSSDTAALGAVLRQFNNVLNAAPQTELEVVCHGNSLLLLSKNNPLFEERMVTTQRRGKVTFKVCANSMRRLGITKDQLLPLAEIVPVAILEISAKQQLGWSYIKAG